MEIVFTPEAITHLSEWQKSGNTAVQKKIQELLLSIRETQFQGVGKPETLKHQLSGKWSRRINKEHRIIYAVSDDLIKIYALKGHY
ncbi:Txe/YoeB family addiction module toxin [Mucilaginibacter gossypii]|uniref:Txe/YoeB family addiction module toxin n=1 Tax=Mucilaginibacter gossypii TaxID=551996 RepID=UPI000DCDB58E|nr:MULTISPECIES: Txe/YoeB family addiction module toxin [Mucilaginibacter]QTE34570.1 Txe/YoeB family addiction module toxin [Mucilaginibacter gossypii]RAV57676.1 Txe/YoeB family addiction module toxin [Mucilaginibacter rubeus]